MLMKSSTKTFLNLWWKIRVELEVGNLELEVGNLMPGVIPGTQAMRKVL